MPLKVMSIGKTIRIFLASGSVTGVRHAEIVNWTGQALSCPRPQVKSLSSWEEACKPGVYFLFGDDPESGSTAAYIGEAENIYDRLQNHLANKEFWNEVVLFTSKDENLTKAHVKYLESNLVRLAKQAARQVLLNGNVPQLPTLPRGDRSAMEEFVINIRTLLGVLGHKTLEPITQPVRVPVAPQEQLPTEALSQATDQAVEISLSVGGIDAKGALTNEGLVVFEGSYVSPEIRDSLSHGYRKIREKLLNDGVVVDVGGQLQFSRSHIFASPSQAAAIIVGYAINGRHNWKLNNGQSVKEYEEGAGGI